MSAYETLKNMSDEQLIALYDNAAQTASGGLGFYRDELEWRESARREEELLRFTREIRWLTVAVTAATIVALAISILALLGGH